MTPTTIQFDRQTLYDVLAAMKAEAILGGKIEEEHHRPEEKRAWFQSQIGAYELACRMGWITQFEMLRYEGQLREEMHL